MNLSIFIVFVLPFVLLLGCGNDKPSDRSENFEEYVNETSTDPVGNQALEVNVKF